ncbi:hypothetical protein NDU88_007291 [Pleurodeles waltl]|uniref:Uncharacterized protein n=1 Tax=Pleurodeles waltl TaxID=8319 RepID=A0AAV7N3B4_PLEWA|nr:hypothetical protein NDU88_007291 [Pleurodeles waltl]
MKPGLRTGRSATICGRVRPDRVLPLTSGTPEVGQTFTITGKRKASPIKVAPMEKDVMAPRKAHEGLYLDYSTEGNLLNSILSKYDLVFMQCKLVYPVEGFPVQEEEAHNWTSVRRGLLLVDGAPKRLQLRLVVQDSQPLAAHAHKPTLRPPFSSECTVH